MTAKLPPALSSGEEAFAIAWRSVSGWYARHSMITLPVPVREYQFLDSRKWRFDFAWPEQMVAVEIEGGVHDGPTRGRHNRSAGYRADLEKYNAAAMLNWTVVRLTPDMIDRSQIMQIGNLILTRINSSGG